MRTAWGAVGLCAGLLLVLSGTGCKYHARNHLSRHVLPVCPKGELAPFRFTEPEPSDYLPQAREPNIGSQIDYILAAAQLESESRTSATEPLRLLVHVHGGRTTWKGGAELADDLITVMGEDGRRALATRGEGVSEDWSYPIFVQWNSGDISTAKDRLLFLRQGKHLPVLGPVSSPVILSHDLVRGIARLPRSLAYQVLRDANVALSVATGRPALGSISGAESLVADLSESGMGVPKYDVREAQYERSRITHGWRFLVYFVTQPTKIGFQLLLEGLGQGAWDEMRRRAHSLVWKPGTFESTDQADPIAAWFSGENEPQLQPEEANGALPELYRKIGQLGRPVELILVGHSMGTIALNDSLRCLTEVVKNATPRLDVVRIIYMAPACSSIEAADALVPLLEQSRDRRSALEEHQEREGADLPALTQFHYLALHPIAEADETNIGDLVPRGSLLEWIDVYYTNPATVPERVFGKWSNAIPALPLFASVASQVQFKAFDVKGGSFPQKHGQFHEIPFWTRAAFETGADRDPDDDTVKQQFDPNWLGRRCSDVLDQCEQDVTPYRSW